VAILGTAFNAMTGRLKNLIREAQKAREELAESNQELRRSNEDLEQFAFASSHDLRSPLRSIAMLRNWIDEDIAQTESASNDVRDHLQVMDQQIGRMSRLLDDLLEYARIGKAEAKTRLFDPEEVTRNALALLQIPPTFKVDIVFESRQIMAIPIEFELVVRNLLDNAVKHHDMPTGALRVSGDYDGDTLILEVADDGPGIPPSYHEKVLEPFATLKRRDECEGSGLGLALVNKIVQRWNGHLEILSQGGMRGTTFRITMPIRRLKVVAGTESEPSAPPPRAAFDSVAS
jgi:signal transduction histidine kinase